MMFGQKTPFRMWPGSSAYTLNRRLPEGSTGLWLPGHQGGALTGSTGYGVRPNMAGRGPGGGFDATAANSGNSFSGVGRMLGGSLSNTSTLHGTNLCADNAFLFPVGSTMTVIIGVEKTDSTLRDATLWSCTDTILAARGGTYCPWSDGNVYFDWGGATNGVTRLTVGGLTHTGYHSYGFTVGPRGMELYQDGLLVGSNAATPTKTQNNTSFIIGNGSQTGVGGDLNRHYFLYTHRDQLPGSLISQIMWDPYGMLLEPDMPRSNIFLPGVASATAFPWLYYATQRTA